METIGAIIAKQAERMIYAPGKIPLPSSYVRDSVNFTADEKRILEAESTGKKFLQMDQEELTTAGIMICYRISKMSGCMLPKHPDVEKQKTLLLDLYKTVGNFIYNNKRFRLLTAAEVVLAASWNAAGEFTEKAKHWQQELNLDYVGDLLNLYCRHKARFDLKEKLEMESIKFLPQSGEQDPFFWEKEIELLYQQFLSGKYRIKLWQWIVYDKMADLKLLPYHSFVHFLSGAYAKVLDDLQVEFAELQRQGKALHRIQEKYNYVFEYKHSNPYVLALAKRMAVKNCFEQCRVMGYANLFVKG